MSFLRKRSRSQCSFSKGDEEITVTRVQQNEFNPQSRAETFVSSRSSVEVGASDFAVHDSCVIRNFPKHKSSHLRFLAWVAYTRKYTDEWITDDERRTCPLLWCRSVFKDQEEMLKHVWNCQQLSKGLYWCFHCQKPERVGKFQCKKCQGLPSRTDRMASVAKKIFSKLGSKPHHADFFTPATELQQTLSKKAEASMTPYPYNPASFEGMSHSFNEDQVVDWNHQSPQELPNTAICRELPGDWTAASHELPDTYISEMQGTECPIELGVGSEDWTDNFYASSLEEWEEPAIKSKATSPKLARIDTSFTHLNSHMTSKNRMEMSPQKHSMDSWEVSLPDTIISPLSASGGLDYNTFEVSPTDTEASGNSFFTDSGYSTATTISAWSTTTTSFADPASLQRLASKKQSRPFGMISNDWVNNIASSRPQELSLMPVLANVPQMSKGIPMTMGSGGSRFTGSEKPVLTSVHWLDGRSLVQYFSEILEAHIQHTKSSLKQLPSSPLVTELMALSRSSVASIGLETLAGVLEGRKPTSIVQIFSLTHVAYAFAIATDNDGIDVQEQFHDSLSWAEELTSQRQRQMYHDIARSIWQPLDIFAEDVPYQASRSSIEENVHLTACKHFLDVFESFNNPQSVPSLPQGRFDFAQEIFQSRCKTQVIDELIRTHAIEAFDANVVAVGRRLREGKITNARQLELELICAGKLVSQPAQVFATFVKHVTRLCDSVYRDEAGTFKSRTECHIQDISVIKQYLPEEQSIHEHEEDDCNHAEQHNHAHNSIDDLLDLDFDDTRSEDIEACIKAFKDDADQTLGQIDINFTNPSASASVHTNEQAPFVQKFNSTYQQSIDSFQQQLPPQSSASTPQPTLPASSPESNSNKYRCHCGYTPSGEERWKASNLRRHKRTQHPAELRVHRCGYPGCKSVFTRSDNLRSHRRDKGHFVGFDGGSFSGEGPRGMGIGNIERGSKRRKVGE